jgi:2-oxo-4-hydroxy-4-carboxy--5-ureidoimidazoline (OHCU) decarboxylase
MELDGQAYLRSEEQDSGGLTKLVSEEHDDLAALLDRYFSMSDM